MESQPAAKRSRMRQVRLEAVLPDELVVPVTLECVYVAPIRNPKLISKAIVDLNAKLPVSHLQHLKRTNGREILLFPCSWSPNALQLLHEKNVATECFDLENVHVAQVAAHAPKTKHQHKSATKSWPCNFHSDKYVEQLVTNQVFSLFEVEVHVKLLQLAVQVSRLSSNSETQCGVIIADPSRDNVIVAGGFSLSGCNPILHAPMTAIDNVAKTQGGGAYRGPGNDEMRAIPWHSMLEGEYENFKVLQRAIGHNADLMESTLSDNEYLCTNYHVYMTHEPCLMCAMALVHSRAKRVFYIRPTAAGALATTCKIHAIKSLNHHYEVFRVAPEDWDLFERTPEKIRCGAI